MRKQVLILSGSPRKGGNSDLLCDAFMKGAQEAGHQIEKVRVFEKKICGCCACYGCEDTGICVIKDDMAELLQKMIDADCLVLASPVYFYSIAAQLKAVIDRTFARWQEVRDKELYYILTAGDTDRANVEKALTCFRGYADCIEGGKEMGVLCGTGLHGKGEVATREIMQEAYEMGLRV